MIASASICGEDSDTVNSLNQNGGSRPDPNTVEMVRYYKKAQEEHGFRLIDVSEIFRVWLIFFYSYH